MKRRLLFSVGFVLLLFSGIAQCLTLSDIRTAVRKNIRDTDPTLRRYSDANLLPFINEGQRDVINNTWIVSKSSSITSVASQVYYSFPSDLISVERITRSYGNLPEVTLNQMDFDTYNSTWEVTTGNPKYFYQNHARPTEFGVFPPSTSGSETYRLIYYAQGTDLSSDSDIPFNSSARFYSYHDLLTWYATFRILFIEGFSDKAALFKDMYDTRLRVLYEDYGAKPEKVPTVVTKENK